MELLLFEDPLDRAHPGAVGAAADVLDLGDDVLLLDRRRLGDPGHVAVAPRQLRVGLHGQEVDEVLAIVVGHFVGGLDAHARLDLRQHLASQVAHGCLLPRLRIPYRRSITRTALPSERGSVRGATIVSWTERPIAFWRRSATRRRRLAITGCSASKPPQRSTSSGPGSTCTSRVARVERRSTTSW